MEVFMFCYAEPIFLIIGASPLCGVIIAFALGILYRKKSFESEISSAEEEAKRIINESIKSAKTRN